VRRDQTITPTQSDIDLGEVIVDAGFAPLKPAAFVVLRNQQTSGRPQLDPGRPLVCQSGLFLKLLRAGQGGRITTATPERLHHERPYSAIPRAARRRRRLLLGVHPASVTFNSVLLNRYRTGQDSVSWHSDDEPEFGANPVIASVSLGGTRTFQLRHKRRKGLKASVELTHGSLLLMRGATQHHWLHQIPKTAKDVAERVNLTFRVVRAAGV
jgi:hypothetical protein